MSFEFKFPDPGEGINEGEIKEFLVKEGDVVKEHDIVAKVETDKAIVPIPISKGGKVLSIPHKEGDTIHVGETLMVIGNDDEKVSNDKSVKKNLDKKEDHEVREKKIESKKSTSVVGFIPEEEDEEDVKPKRKVESKKESDVIEHNLRKVMALPSVRKLARDLNVDLSLVNGTGKNGRITSDDVRKYSESGETKKESKSESNKSSTESKVQVQSKYDMYGPIEHIPLKGVRRTIAHKMVESYTKIPHVTHFDEADVTNLWDIREREKIKAKKKGIKLTFMPFIIKACIVGLKEYPYVSSILDEENEEITLKKYYNIGFAVDTEDGLMVPVVKEADQKSIPQIANEIDELAGKAKDRNIDLGDLQGGVFTITNIGSIGGTFATPIINHPEAAILGLGRIYDKVTVNSKGEFESRKVLPLSLSFDHRILDGAQAAKFVNRVKQVLEDPDELFID